MEICEHGRIENGEGVCEFCLLENPNDSYEKYIIDLLAYIHNTPKLTSLLYDIDMLPEQTVSTKNYRITMLIAGAWRMK